ncbi:hypothetical protein [Nocardia rhizosphaerae]|uniref:Uncharacterized protein n=1 Tax=Nocardia rhizosphaerae TaxID=1691571 RepID=A0ABV8L5U8_9NOCA
MARAWVIAQVVHYDEKTLREMPDSPGGRTLKQLREQFGGDTGTITTGNGRTIEFPLTPLEGLSEYSYISIGFLASQDDSIPRTVLGDEVHLLVEIDGDAGF